MKTLPIAMALLLGVPTALLADVTKEDLRKLCAAGISEDLILNFVKSNGPLAQLSAGDLVELKQAGASDSLLSTLLGAAPAAVPAPAVIPPAASPDAPDLVTVSAPDVVLSAPPTYSAVPAYDDACLSPCPSYDTWGYPAPTPTLGCSPYVGIYGGGSAAYRGGTRWGERRLVRNGLTWTRGNSPQVTGGQVLRRPVGGTGVNSRPVFSGGHVGSPSGSTHSGFSGGHAGGASFGGGGHGGHR